MKTALLIGLSALLLPLQGKAQSASTPPEPEATTKADQQPDLSRPVEVTGKREPMYRYYPKIDLPISAVGTIWSAFAFSKIYSKDSSTLAQILALKKEDVNGFDRWAAGKHSKQAANTSDIFFYGSVPLPFFLLADRKIRRDAGRVGLLYWEAFSITGLLYTGSTYFVDRYRPETYSDEIPAGERVDGNYRNAFFAGHVSVVSTSTFFMASVYNQYHPHSPWRWAFWGGAVAATGATIYLRHEAGKHWPSDLVVGTAVGTLSGILVPHLHLNKNAGRQAWNLSPYRNYRNAGTGLSFNYRF